MRLPRRQTLPYTAQWRPGRLSMVGLLLALQVTLYLGQLLIEMIAEDSVREPGWVLAQFGLHGTGIAAGHYWQFASFLFIQAGPLPALINLSLLFLAGREVEQIAGGRHLLAVFLVGNLVGGAGQWLINPQTNLVGTSPGVAALLLVFTTTLPALETSFRLPFFGSVPIKAKYLANALIAVCAVLCALGRWPTWGPVAVLIGALVGWNHARWLGYGTPFFWQRMLMARRQRAARLATMGSAEFIATQVDPVLDKISRQGLRSLTRAERRILEQGREKMDRPPRGGSRNRAS